MKYVKAKEAIEALKISRPTLKAWKDSGKIKSKKISDKLYLYDIDSVLGKNSNDEIAHDQIVNRQLSLVFDVMSAVKANEHLGQSIQKVFENSSGQSLDFNEMKKSFLATLPALKNVLLAASRQLFYGHRLWDYLGDEQLSYWFMDKQTMQPTKREYKVNASKWVFGKICGEEYKIFSRTFDENFAMFLAEFMQHFLDKEVISDEKTSTPLTMYFKENFKHIAKATPYSPIEKDAAITILEYFKNLASRDLLKEVNDVLRAKGTLLADEDEDKAAEKAKNAFTRYTEEIKKQKEEFANKMKEIWHNGEEENGNAVTFYANSLITDGSALYSCKLDPFSPEYNPTKEEPDSPGAQYTFSGLPQFLEKFFELLADGKVDLSKETWFLKQLRYLDII